MAKVSAENREKANKLRELAQCCEEEAGKLESGEMRSDHAEEKQGWETFVIPLIAMLVQWFTNRKKT